MSRLNEDKSLLEKLYKEQLQTHSDIYLFDHSRNSAVIQRHIEAFYRYKMVVPKSARVLDWGCRHAVDSCLMRRAFGDEIELYGCDVGNNIYSAFHDYAQLKYSQITHSYLLPYEANYFDVVVGSGVLEHVPDESASLRELYRILKPEGVLVITFLPNSSSYSELINRFLGNFYHVRRYRLKQIRRCLLQHGFMPVLSGYHQVMPTLSSGMALANYSVIRRCIEAIYNMNYFMERVWPIKTFAANIFIVSKKKTYFSDSWN